MGKKSKKKAKKAKKDKKAKRTNSTRRPAAKAERARPRARRAATPKRAGGVARKDPMRDLAKRIVDLTIRGDDSAAFALYGDNVESVEMGMPPGIGIPALREKYAMWRAMASDARWTARSVVVDGNTIVVEWQGRVTLAPSGRTVNLNEIAIHEIENGKIVRERFYYDPRALQP